VKNEEALQIVERAGGTISSTALVSAGARWEDLYRLRDEGRLVEISRGLYRLSDAPLVAHLDLIAVSRRTPNGMICLASAAAFWDLTDEIPRKVHLAVPRNRHRPQITYPPTAVHVFAAETFEVGRARQELEGGESIWITSPERTVVDLLRLTRMVGRDQALGALRRYLDSADHRPAVLLSVAHALHAAARLRAVMEPMLA
jgi:predicted transcriptional regulator of viral defense system